MRVTVYDKNPGVGLAQWFLKTSWFLGCFIQKLLGQVDAYYGATSWLDAIEWLTRQPKPLMSIQYWGHGSPGRVWLAQKTVAAAGFLPLKSRVAKASVIWFRTCSTFQGQEGYDFSANLSNLLDCTVAGHTRIVGLLQGGLHTRAPHTDPSWPITDGEFPPSHMASNGLKSGNNTVTCFATEIPHGW